MKGKSCLPGIYILLLLMAVCLPSEKVQASTVCLTCSQAIGTSHRYSVSGFSMDGYMLKSSSWVLSGSGGYISSKSDYGCTVAATGIGTATLSWRTTWQKSYVLFDPVSGKSRTQIITESHSHIWKITIGKPFTVSFNAAGGSVSPASKQIVAGGNAIYGELPTPTKTGYYFDGWYTEDGQRIIRSSQVQILSDHTLYAQWIKRNSYTIQFDGNGSTDGNVDFISCKYGYTYKLPYNSFRRKGYWFAGWNTRSDGTGHTYTEGENVSNLTTIEGGVITFYAMWSDDDIASGTCGSNISWAIDADYCLNIGGSGSMPDGTGSDKENSTIFEWLDDEYIHKINKIVVKEGITHIGDYAFCRGAYLSNSSIKEVQLPGTLTSVGDGAFKNCKGIESIQIPNSSVQTIGKYAFQGCESLRSIELGTGVSTIEDYAIDKTGLTAIHLPASVQTISGLALKCDSLKQITIDADNPYYTAKDNVLYNKHMTEIVAFPAGRKEDVYIIPDGITALGDSVFSSGKFTTLVVPASVKSIGPNCFYDNQTLKNIYFRGDPPKLLTQEVTYGDGYKSYAFDNVYIGMWYPRSKQTEWEAVKDSYENAYQFTEPILGWLEYNLSKNISECTITVDSSESLVYDGTEKTPKVSVIDTGATTSKMRSPLPPLIEGTDYKVEYGNNTDAGSAYVTVTGLGDYADTSQKAGFTIQKAPQTPEITVSADTINKGGQAVIESAEGYGSFTYTSSNEQILTVDADGVITGAAEGTAKVIATAAGDDNHDSGLAEVSITVHEHSFNGQGVCDCGAISIDKHADIKITPINVTYSGKELLPSVKVTYQGTELTVGTDYEVRRAGGTGTEDAGSITKTDAGTYDVVVIGIGNYGGSKTVTWEIKPKELTPSITGTVSKAYDGTTDVPAGHDLAVSLTEIVEGDNVTAAAEFIYQDKNAGTGKTVTANAITLEGDDKDNYCLSVGTSSANVGTITKADPQYTKPSGLTAVCGDMLSAVSLEGTGFSWEDDTIVLYADSKVEAAKTVECKASYTPADTKNYNKLTEIPLTVMVAHDLEAHNTGEGKHDSKCKNENCTFEAKSVACSGGEATCTKKAVCSICNTEYGEINPENHKWDAGTVTKAAICTQEGEMIFTCQYDKTHTRTEIIAIDENAHDYGSWQQCDEKQHKRVCKNDSEHIDYADHTFVEKIDKAATASKDGSKHEECSTCGYKKQSVRIPATGVPEAGTSLKDAKTGNCYTVVNSGKKQVKYTGPDNKNVKQVSVPVLVTVDGITYTVTEIGKNAFSGCKKLTKVTIGKDVKTIGTSAFSGCNKLKTVSMGANVTTIGDKAFYKCTALTKITIPAKVNKIGKQAFYGCKKLKTITIKTSKLTSKKVGSKAFKGIYAKATIKVPKKKLTSYKRILKAKGVGSKVKIKK